MINKISIVRTKLIKEYSLSISDKKVYSIEEAEPIFRKLIGDSTLEKVAILCMNPQNKAINASLINIGSSASVELDISEICRVAILCNASFVIVAHNHPSGILKPSKYDINITKKIGYALSIFGIKLIDSIILGEKDESLSIRGNLDKLEEL